MQIDHNQWKSKLNQLLGFDFYWFPIPINWLLLIIIDYIDFRRLLIFIDWYRRVETSALEVKFTLINSVDKTKLSFLLPASTDAAPQFL